MGFENHSRRGLLEQASRIALKHDVTYSHKTGEFRGEPAAVEKAAQALDRWRSAESSRVFRDSCS